MAASVAAILSILKYSGWQERVWPRLPPVQVEGVLVTRASLSAVANGVVCRSRFAPWLALTLLENRRLVVVKTNDPLDGRNYCVWCLG